MNNEEEKSNLGKNLKLYIILGVVGVAIIGLVFMFAMRDVQKDGDFDSIVDNLEKEEKKEKENTKDTMVKEVGFYIPTQSEIEKYMLEENGNTTFQDVAYEGDMDKLVSDYGYTDEQASVLQLLISRGNILTGNETKLEKDMYNGFVLNLVNNLNLFRVKNLNDYLNFVDKSKTVITSTNQLFLNNPVLDYQSDFIGTFTSGFTKVSDKENIYMGYPVIERYNAESNLGQDEIYFIEVQYLVGSDIPVEKLEKIANDLKPSINGKIAKTGEIFKDLKKDIEKNRSEDYKNCYARHNLVSTFCYNEPVDAEEVAMSIESLDEIKLSFYKHSDVLDLYYNRGETILSGSAIKAIYMIDKEDIPTNDFNLNIGKEVYEMSKDATETTLPYKFN